MAALPLFLIVVFQGTPCSVTSPEDGAMVQPNYLSKEGLEKLKAELEQLRTVGRHEVAERIQQ